MWVLLNCQKLGRMSIDRVWLVEDEKNVISKEYVLESVWRQFLCNQLCVLVALLRKRMHSVIDKELLCRCTLN